VGKVDEKVKRKTYPSSDRERLLRVAPEMEKEYDQFADLLCEAMRKAGIDERRIYATRTTGLLPTADNAQFMTRADWKEWNAALAEFDAKRPEATATQSGTSEAVVKESLTTENGSVPTGCNDTTGRKI
jgi:hypothetical protein